MCGLPLDSHDAAASENSSPWGNQDFVTQFLAQTRETLNGRLRTLATFINTMDPETPAVHVALAVVRTQLQTRHVHLARFCHRAVFPHLERSN